ncbi:MAG: glycine dehydrogenase, partial [Planctomycetota bacterium]
LYLSLLGPQGLRETAFHCAWKTQHLAEQISASERFEVAFAAPAWREIAVRDRQKDVSGLLAAARAAGFQAGLPLGRWYPGLADCLLIAVTEKRTRDEIDRLVHALEHAAQVEETAHA